MYRQAFQGKFRLAPPAQEFDKALTQKVASNKRSRAPKMAADLDLLNYVKSRMMQISDYHHILGMVDTAASSELITKNFKDVQNQKKQLEPFFQLRRVDGRPQYSNPHYYAAYGLLREMLTKVVGDVVLKPLDINTLEIGDIFSNKNSVVGYLHPDSQKKDCFPFIKEVGKYMYKEMPSEKVPVMVGHRAQISNFYDEKARVLTPMKTKRKDRAIFIQNAATVMVEGLYAKPFTDRILSRVSMYAGGKSDTEIQLTLQGWLTTNWICIDYKGYDNTLPHWVNHSIFNLIRSFFPKSEWKKIDWCEDQFNNAVILDLDGKLRHKVRGILSGSFFTQIVGSLANLLMVLTYLFHKYKGDKKAVIQDISIRGRYTLMAMGDDNIICTRNRINKYDLASYMSKVFGVVIDIDEKFKQGGLLDDKHFLKRTWTDRGGYRNIVDLLINATNPERKREYEKKGFHPVHVLYGYYLAYPAALKPYFDYEELLSDMNRHGGAVGLENIPTSSLPGSIRLIKVYYPQRWQQLLSALRVRLSYFGVPKG